jgi:hypothetical protein
MRHRPTIRDPTDQRQPALQRQTSVTVHHRASWSCDLDSHTIQEAHDNNPTVNNLGGQYN